MRILLTHLRATKAEVTKRRVSKENLRTSPSLTKSNIKYLIKYRPKDLVDENVDPNGNIQNVSTYESANSV
jgi:hypothetical protein